MKPIETTPVNIRGLEPADNLAELTSLLHRAYSELAQMGLHFLATHQSEDVTRERALEGECYIAEIGDRLVGTIVFRDSSQTCGCAYYDRPEVASFGQFGVDPAFRDRGIGSALLELVERRAAETGAHELALDTAEPAKHLISLYERRGYRVVDGVKWDSVNYPSVIMSKKLEFQHAP